MAIRMCGLRVGTLLLQIVPSSSKVPKGVHVRSHTSNSFIIEIRAVALSKMPGWKTLRTLADVCKAASVAVSCRSLDQLCSAALAQAVQQMKLPGLPASLDSHHGSYLCLPVIMHVVAMD